MQIDYKFKNKALLERALTHSSKSATNYERLEFLGDSILDFIVGEFFFKNTEKNEGELTVLRSLFVSEQNLHKVFDKLDIEKDVVLGKSFKGEISHAIKGDIVEAIIAAIYLDSGIDCAREFIVEKLELKNYKKVKDENYKSHLQEQVQATFKCKMVYKTEKVENGFESKFYLADDEISNGFGLDKTSAEQDCAKNAIKKLFQD